MTTARDRIVAALQPKLGHATASRGYVLSDGDVQFLAGYLADGVLEVVEELRAEELRSAADALHVQRFNGNEDPTFRWPPGAPREVPTFYRGVVMAEHQLRARAAEITDPRQTASQKPSDREELPQCTALHESGYRCRQRVGHPAGRDNGGHRNQDLTW